MELIQLKYFYTDPLAAAWMAKHHEMDFEGLSWMEEEFCFALHDPENEPSHYYIHPDSLHLLEPQVDDVIRDDVDHEYQTVWKDEKGLGMDTSKGTASPSGIIIQRNGKAFHWPEVEEV